jgi:DNA (cytosine-5)-methyltransferase 1
VVFIVDPPQTPANFIGIQKPALVNAFSPTISGGERIFIAGFLDETEFSFEDMKVPDPLKGPKLRTILHPGDGGERPEPHFTVGNAGGVSEKYTLSNHLWTYLKDYAEKHRLAGNGFGYGLFGPDDVARTLSARYYKDGSEILIRQGRKAPRRLTPRECARLMGFDAPGESKFRIPVSDTQAYKQFGNSVAVPAVTAVARHMEPHIRAAVAEVECAMRGKGSRPLPAVVDDIGAWLTSGTGHHEIRGGP